MTTEFIQQYLDLLIFQYQGQPRAEAEINFMGSQGEAIFELLQGYRKGFDLDSAIGHQLDVVGRIVGFERIVPYTVSKIRFGFAENDYARGFASKFNEDRLSAPFLSRFEPTLTSYELDDESYRIFLRMKIAKNVGMAYLTTNDGISLQDAAEIAFGLGAHAIDREDMTVHFWIPYRIGEQRARIAVKERLFPLPQGVALRYVFFGTAGQSFGFKANENALGFASKFDFEYEGGYFARKLII